jgi:hypothetical protein
MATAKTKPPYSKDRKLQLCSKCNKYCRRTLNVCPHCYPVRKRELTPAQAILKRERQGSGNEEIIAAQIGPCCCCGKPDLYAIHYRTHWGIECAHEGYPTCTGERLCDSCEAKFGHNGKRPTLRKVRKTATERYYDRWLAGAECSPRQDCIKITAADGRIHHGPLNTKQARAFLFGDDASEGGA